MITVQTTPNPNALKFIVGERWIGFVWECNNERDAAKSQLAKVLWAIDGVVYLMFGSDFVSISKKQNVSWEKLQPEIIDAIDEFLQKDIGLFEDNIKIPLDGQSKKSKLDIELSESNIEYTELEIKIIHVLDEKVRPVLESHGGMVKFVSFHDGVVVLDLQGACKGCPSSMYTLKNGIENLLKYYFPEVKEVAS